MDALERGHFADARSAPFRPEIHDHKIVSLDDVGIDRIAEQRHRVKRQIRFHFPGSLTAAELGQFNITGIARRIRLGRFVGNGRRRRRLTRYRLGIRRIRGGVLRNVLRRCAAGCKAKQQAQCNDYPSFHGCLSFFLYSGIVYHTFLHLKIFFCNNRIFPLDNRV